MAFSGRPIIAEAFLSKTNPSVNIETTDSFLQHHHKPQRQLLGTVITLLEIRRRSASLLQLQILKSTKLRSPSLLLQMLYIRQINDDRAADSTYFKWALSTKSPTFITPVWCLRVLVQRGPASSAQCG